MKEGPRKEEIAGARAALARAQASLENVRSESAGIAAQGAGTVAAQCEIESHAGAGRISQSQLDDTVIATPIDGVVLVKSAEAGEVVAAGTTIVTIGDLDHPWLRAYINETDLGRVKLGQKVKLTTDSYPGQSLLGHGVLHRL